MVWTSRIITRNEVDSCFLATPPDWFCPQVSLVKIIYENIVFCGTFPILKIWNIYVYGVCDICNYIACIFHTLYLYMQKCTNVTMYFILSNCWCNNLQGSNAPKCEQTLLSCWRIEYRIGPSLCFCGVFGWLCSNEFAWLGMGRPLTTTTEPVIVLNKNPGSWTLFAPLFSRVLPAI